MSFPFFRLPLEIREHIYRYTLKTDCHELQNYKARPIARDGIVREYAWMMNCPQANMLRVQKQVYEEYMSTALRHMSLALFFVVNPSQKETLRFSPLPYYTGLPKRVHDVLRNAEFHVQYELPPIRQMGFITNLTRHLPALRKLNIEVHLDERRLNSLHPKARVPAVEHFFTTLPRPRPDFAIATYLVVVSDLFAINTSYKWDDGSDEHIRFCELWTSSQNVVRFRARSKPNPDAYTYHGLELEPEPDSVTWEENCNFVAERSDAESREYALELWRSHDSVEDTSIQETVT